MRRWIYCLICLVTTLLISSWGLAQPPPVSMNLSFVDCTSCSFGQPVGVRVEVVNTGTEQILINEGFTATEFYLKMRIIDPAGQLIGVIPLEPSTLEAPDAPPVPWLFRDGRHIRFVPWEVLDPGVVKPPSTVNLLDHYPLSLPGYYSAQVLLSAMIFKPHGPGNIHNYAWQGVLKSNRVYFYYEGATEVKVKPERWPLAWLQGKGDDHDDDLVKVNIWPEEGKTAGDYVLESIRFNNMEPFKVRVKKSVIELGLIRYRAIGSLGPVEKGQWYPVMVSGKLTSGRFFGGGAKVKIR